MTPLPAAERAGLVFVTLRPDAPLALDDFLCGYDEVLEHLGLARCHLAGRQAVAGPNWKIAYDGYLDFEAGLAALLRSPELAAAMGARGDAYVRREFAWDAVAPAFLDAMDRAATSGATRLAGGRITTP